MNKHMTEAIRRIPKVVLHDHLDGGLRPTTIIELAEAAGYDNLPTHNPDALKRWFFDAANAGSLPQYISTFEHTVGVMQTTAALGRVAREAVIDLAEDNVIYAELRFAPELHQRQGLRLQAIVDAVIDGCHQGEDIARQKGKEIHVRLLLCAMRDGNRSEEIAQLVVDNYGTNSTVVGFDIAGPEADYPPEAHAAAFGILRKNAIPFTIHAGEADGVQSIKSAVSQGAKRLGHGVRIIEDVASDGTLGAVAQSVRNGRVALECCPRSNVQTGAVAKLSEHPLLQLEKLGFSCTVNPDNRLVSGTSMSGEMGVLSNEFGYTLQQLRKLTVTAMQAAFIDEARKRDITERLIIPGYENGIMDI